MAGLDLFRSRTAVCHWRVSQKLPSRLTVNSNGWSLRCGLLEKEWRAHHMHQTTGRGPGPVFSGRVGGGDQRPEPLKPLEPPGQRGWIGTNTGLRCEGLGGAVVPPMQLSVSGKVR